MREINRWAKNIVNSRSLPTLVGWTTLIIAHVLVGGIGIQPSKLQQVPAHSKLSGFPVNTAAESTLAGTPKHYTADINPMSRPDARSNREWGQTFMDAMGEMAESHLRCIETCLLSHYIHVNLCAHLHWTYLYIFKNHILPCFANWRVYLKAT